MPWNSPFLASWNWSTGMRAGAWGNVSPCLDFILYRKLNIREHKYYVFHNKPSAPSAGDPRSFREFEGCMCSLRLPDSTVSCSLLTEPLNNLSNVHRWFERNCWWNNARVEPREGFPVDIFWRALLLSYFCDLQLILWMIRWKKTLDFTNRCSPPRSWIKHHRLFRNFA
jgi:hypothetical protein